MFVSGITIGKGGTGKIIGGGRGISTCTVTPAITDAGAKTINIKREILKINFFIEKPPLFKFNHDHRAQ